MYFQAGSGLPVSSAQTSLAQGRSRVVAQWSIDRWHHPAGIDKSLALERKIESRKRNFSLDLENLIVSISLSTLDFWEWQETILFLLSIFESGKTNFSFYSRFSRVSRQNSLSTLDFSLNFWEFKSRVQHHKSVSLREGCKKIHVKSLVFCL